MNAIGRHHYVGDILADGSTTNEVAFTAAASERKAHEAKVGTCYAFKAQFDIAAYNTGTCTLRVRIGTITGDIAASVVWTPVAGEDAILEGEIMFEAIGAVGTSQYHGNGEGWATGEAVTRTILQDRTVLETRAPWSLIPTVQWSAGHADNDAVLKSFRVWEVGAKERS